MPELPEVETMVRDLSQHIVGSTISSVEADFPGSIVWPTFEEAVERVVGRRIENVSRRGKFAAFQLDSPDLLIVHRGMTGSLLLRRPDDPMESHVRVCLTLHDGRQLRFNDPRKFGKLYVMDAAGSERPLPWVKMGPEPLNGAFSLNGFRAALAGRTAPIKPLLLGQHVVAGLGNIYVDEALFRARIHPQRPAGTLRPAEVRRLHVAIQEVLTSAVEGRGTTFSSYTDVEGRAGNYQSALQVFQRTGQNCFSCGATITRLVVGGRGTHICPRCQRS